MTKIKRMGRDAAGEFPWRFSKQIAAIRGQVKRAADYSEDGATVTLPIGTARALVEICRQAEHTEKNHEGLFS